MTDPSAHPSRHERDYIDRTIETVRVHQGADNCWPQWANIFADDIEDLRAERDALAARLAEVERDATHATQLADALRDLALHVRYPVAWGGTQNIRHKAIEKRIDEAFATTGVGEAEIAAHRIAAHAEYEVEGEALRSLEPSAPSPSGEAEHHAGEQA